MVIVKESSKPSTIILNNFKSEKACVLFASLTLGQSVTVDAFLLRKLNF